MTLPRPVASAIAEVIGEVTGVSSVGGGCISTAVRVEAGGRPYFLKFDRGRPPGFFEAEAEGLRQLRAAESGLAIPAVVALGEAGDGWGWLAMEWMEPGSPGADYGARLGRGLAALHRAPTERDWGWERDGFIGTLPQVNEPTTDWADFWVERRLRPQLRVAVERGWMRDGERWARLFELAPELLAHAAEDGPSLIHGDLWSGNVMATRSGAPALVDPAAYRGHREVDLAMSELFGGFDSGFYASYQEAWPLLPGYPERRRALYQLYFLLVHVNIFGASYVQRTERTLDGLMRAI